jgi:hypothetical protein
MSLRSIFLTVLVFCAAWYWLRARELKDHILKYAARYCDDLSLKLLDESVVLKELRPHKSSQRGFCLKRRYVFEFTSTGEDRYQGEIIIIGRHIEEVKLETHRVQ